VAMAFDGTSTFGAGKGVRITVGEGLTSITPADENSPNLPFNGATRQKYLPGSMSFTSVSNPFTTRSNTMSAKLRSCASCTR